MSSLPPAPPSGAIRSREQRLKAMASILKRRGLRVELYPFQMDGLVWMLKREKGLLEGPRGGILADESMLGKTLQIVGLLLCTRNLSAAAAAAPTATDFEAAITSDTATPALQSSGSSIGGSSSSGTSLASLDSSSHSSLGGEASRGRRDPQMAPSFTVGESNRATAASSSSVSSSSSSSAAAAKGASSGKKQHSYVDGRRPPTRTLVVVETGRVKIMVNQLDLFMECGKELALLAWEGSTRLRDANLVAAHDIVVTDVQTLRADVKNVHRHPCPSVLARLRWKRLVLDGVPLERCQDALDAVRQLSVRNAWCVTNENILHPDYRAHLLVLMELLGASMSAPRRPANLRESRQNRRQGSRLIQLAEAGIDPTHFVLRRTIKQVVRRNLVPPAVATALMSLDRGESVADSASGGMDSGLVARSNSPPRSALCKIRPFVRFMSLLGRKNSYPMESEPVIDEGIPPPHQQRGRSPSSPPRASVVYVKDIDVALSRREEQWYVRAQSAGGTGDNTDGYPVPREFVNSDLSLSPLSSPSKKRALGSRSKLECLVRLLLSIHSGEFSGVFTRYSGRCRLMGEKTDVNTSRSTRIVIASFHRKALESVSFLLQRMGISTAWVDEDERALFSCSIILLSLDAGSGTGMCPHTLHQFGGAVQRVLIMFDEGIQIDIEGWARHSAAYCARRCLSRSPPLSSPPLAAEGTAPRVAASLPGTSSWTPSFLGGCSDKEHADSLFVFRFVTSELPRRGATIKFGMESLGSAIDKRSTFF